jgi:hypothetical protein
MDKSDTSTEYPFICQSVIHTGHRQNIFNAQMLPTSSRMCGFVTRKTGTTKLTCAGVTRASVSGDKQVRIFDVHGPGTSSVDGPETRYSARESCLRTFKCHAARVKRIITEDSPDSFLTVSEASSIYWSMLHSP